MVMHLLIGKGTIEWVDKFMRMACKKFGKYMTDLMASLLYPSEGMRTTAGKAKTVSLI